MRQLSLAPLYLGSGGGNGPLLLLTFFVGSSALSQSTRAKPAPQRNGTPKAFGVTPVRSWAMGRSRLAWVVLHAASPNSLWPWFGYSAALAAVTADTWATELGALSPSLPRMITHLRVRVASGTSGAVSVLGTLGALASAALIAGLAALLTTSVGGTAWIVALGGLAGALFDSLLGATVQCIYRCPAEGIETEQHPLHRCGTPTLYVRGWPWLNNDLVNAACGAFGSIVACALAFSLGAR